MFMLCVYVLKKKKKTACCIVNWFACIYIDLKLQYLVFILGEDANLSSTYFAT